MQNATHEYLTPSPSAAGTVSRRRSAARFALAMTFLAAVPACRSGRGPRSLVKVTEGPNVVDVDTPAQRLVGSERFENDKLTRRDSVAENRRVSLASASQSRDSRDESLPRLPASNTPSAGDRVEVKRQQVAKQASKAAPPESTPRVRSAQPPVVSTKTVANNHSTSEAQEKTTSQYESMMKAFEAYPPEVRQEAMRRLTASMAASATRSPHPADVDEALSSQLDNLPTLPQVDPNSDRVAQRIHPETGPATRSPSPQVRQASTWGNSPASNVASNQGSTKSRRRPNRQSLVENLTVEALPLANTAETLATDLPSEDRSTAAPPTVRVATLPAGAFATSPTDDDHKQPANVVAKSDIPAPPTATVANPSHSVLQRSGDIRTAAVDQPMVAAAVSQAAISDENATTSSSPVATVSATDSGQPPRTLSDTDDKALYQELIRKLTIVPDGETEADRTARLIKLRHLLVLSGNPDAAAEKIDGMSDLQQDYLRHQLQGLWTMVDPQGHPVARRRLTSAAKDLRQATRFAAAGSDSLEVRGISFCTAIEAYGQTTAFKNNRFKPGQQVILYCEVENFTATKTDAGFETQLQGSYDILDSDGVKVDGQLLPADRQVSSNYLRDYFIAYQMGLPTTLPPGEYTLRLTIEDLNGKKYGQDEIAMSMTK